MVQVILQRSERPRSDRDYPFLSPLTLYPDGAVQLLDVTNIEPVEFATPQAAGIGKIDNRVNPLLPAVGWELGELGTVAF